MNFRLFVLFGLLILGGCDFDKEVEVKLPPYQRQLVTECYLESGKPVRLYLSESDSYFDTLRFAFINEASVVLSQEGWSETIPNLPFFDINTLKFYNYRTGVPLPIDTTKPITLEIKDSTGRRLSGTTKFLPKPDVDTIEVRYAETADSLAGFLVWINDIPGETNYYRIIMNLDSLTGAPAVEFTFTDNGGFDGKRFPVGTTLRFEPKKTMYIRVFHIEQSYYNYLRSISAANRANGNPFAQPATIKSQMEGGGFGLFTTLNYREYKIPY